MILPYPRAYFNLGCASKAQLALDQPLRHGEEFAHGVVYEAVGRGGSRNAAELKTGYVPRHRKGAENVKVIRDYADAFRAGRQERETVLQV